MERWNQHYERVRKKLKQRQGRKLLKQFKENKKKQKVDTDIRMKKKVRTKEFAEKRQKKKDGLELGLGKR